MKLIIQFLIIMLFMVGCKKSNLQDTELIFSTGKDSLKFKSWLSDTLKYLNKETTSNIRIIIPKDSSYLELKKKYDMSIIPDQKYNNKDLDTALFLLKENDTIPKEKFNLLLNVTYFYDIGFENRKYDCTYEIDKFDVKTNNKKIKYSFIKGNLIDKEIIKPKKS